MDGQGYGELPVDRVVTLEEAVEFKTRTASRLEAKTWRFHGSMGSAADCATVANQSPQQGAGEVVIAVNNGVFPLWLYY
ncbi:hypothetical protein ACH49O_19080 [Streptomyces coeruleorubidus]|uniref:hypothetical protein n=1 Tax=Streptomyces coeruleorubidus TaxID=116188 RepID=UPI0033CD8EF6